ncbi:alanine/glycine:cation symporter family protein [Demequina sp. SYSU T00192]|uniref:Alanine/glycine:cation symporter family protein n=1 Tax=Demequina litoralis TaxID=3051660 RepID=A0ABT8G6N0_9MICO|nr:alanine/glycine:cation symporter family protein [Demequina sp. SYSU T00192]MDN4474579.1 alanine/glycine:cation symporter family protein [Demequina sp. SYSU T00192]
MDALESLIAEATDSLWTWAVLPVVAVLGVYFTMRSGVVQIRMLPRMVKGLTDRTPTDAAGRPQSLSAFQAFTVSAASRVGIGNIAGVGTAIAVGGPGAIAWMWLMALVGAATSFIEATLAQLYKHRDASGFRGGPAYYVERGLRARWLGIVLAVVLILAAPFAVTMLQSFTIAETVTDSFTGGAPGWVAPAVAVTVAALTAGVVFGGAHRIALVTETLVPLMALLYLGLGLVIVVLHVDAIGPVVSAIFEDAVSGQAVAGGALGTVILTGVQRGMFSNEAGFGTAPNAAASAATTHPVKQGLVQSLGVYFDTFLVCSITAFIILVTRPDLETAEPGIALTHDAVVGSLGGWAGALLSVIVFLLAFSTILGLYFYGESNIEYITPRRAALNGYRLAVIALVAIGGLVSASLVWSLADLLLGVLALLNLLALAPLSRHVFALLKDFTSQERAGRDPVYTRDRVPGIPGVEVWEDERSVTGLPPQDEPARG